MASNELKVNDRVVSASYGPGTVKEIEHYTRRESIVWVNFDHPAVSRFGWTKQPITNLRHEVTA